MLIFLHFTNTFYSICCVFNFIFWQVWTSGKTYMYKNIQMKKMNVYFKTDLNKCISYVHSAVYKERTWCYFELFCACLNLRNHFPSVARWHFYSRMVPDMMTLRTGPNTSTYSFYNCSAFPKAQFQNCLNY